MRTLYVKSVTIAQLKAHGWPTYGFHLHEHLTNVWIRCNKKGTVNWDKAPVFRTPELIETNNVKIVTS